MPKTEAELTKWMQDNCFNFDHYSIGGNPIPEGFGMEQSGGIFFWYYTEKGEKHNLKAFPDEASIVEYAFNAIRSDPWANAHCICATENESMVKELAQNLTAMNIEFKEDVIPYFGKERPVYRIFVFGCDHLRTFI